MTWESVSQMVGKTLEMGTKIFVCRVDNTHTLVLHLAEDINCKSNRKEAGSNNDPDDETVESDANGNQDGMDPGSEQNVAKKIKSMKKKVQQNSCTLCELTVNIFVNCFDLFALYFD